MTAQGEGRGRKASEASVNCAAKDQSESLLNNRIPVLTGVDRQGGPQPDLPERSSCKLVLRVLSFPFPESSLRLARLEPGKLLDFLHHRGDSLPDTYR